MGHGGAPRQLPASGRTACWDRHALFFSPPFIRTMRWRIARSRPDCHRATGPFYRLRVRPSGARPRAACDRLVRDGGRTVRLPRHQGPPPRRAHHARDLRRRAASACRCSTTSWARCRWYELLATEYPDVAFIIPHLGSFADDWRAQVALIPILARIPQRVHRHVRRAPFRTTAGGAPTRRAWQSSLWLRRAVAASRRRARKGPRASTIRRGRTVGVGRQHPAPDQQRKTEAAVPSSHAVAARFAAPCRRSVAAVS